VGKLKLKPFPFVVMRSCCLFLLIASTLVAAPSSAQKLPADLQKQVDKGFLTRQEAELLNVAKRQPSALTPKKSGSKALPLCDQEDQSRYEQGSYEREGVDFSPYIARLVHQIKLHWHSKDSTRPAVVAFDVKRSGDIEKVHITCSSGIDAFDQAAVDAVQQSTPLLPLPKAFKGTLISMCLCFGANGVDDRTTNDH
jgi:TonB family protein